MNKITKLTSLLAMCMALTAPVLTSCDKDDYDTQQYRGGVNLNVWGPRPVARGGELRFLGSGMDRITSITIPGSGDVTDIKVISDEEIRITVPQDAEPGKVVLHHSGGDITSLTELSFTEPISLDEMTPMTIKPGQTLTLKGEYLNLISEVIFTDEVKVSEEDFISHERHEISLVVPETAQTGEVIISDGALPIPNWIYSEEELTIVLPSVEKVADLTKMKPGETVTFTVKDIDLVRGVVMPDDEAVDFSVEDDKLSFVLPANITDGTICMIPASGVKVAIATIGVALPEEVVADPAENMWSGDVIKFKGVNMELVTEISFPGVETAVAPESVTATEVSVKVPEGAQTGNAVLHTASGGSVEVAVSTLKPEAVSFTPSPAALASSLKVMGRNLQNVVAIEFGESTSVEVKSPSANEFTIEIPATLPAGTNSVVLKLSNEETVACPSIELTAPECAYATVLPSEDDEINAGGTVTLKIANPDKLTGVEVNGNKVQYILNGETLIIQIPASAGVQSEVKLVSSNGSISYAISVIPQTHVGQTIWEGMWESGNWNGNQDLAWGGYDWSQVPDGATLTLYVTPVVAEGEWWCVALRHGKDWGMLPDPIADQYGQPEGGIVAVTLTQNVIDDLVNNGGLVISGSNYVLNKVTVEWEISMETTFWEGNADLTGWAGMQDFAWNDEAIATIFSTWKPGQTIRAYYTCTGGSQPCLKFASGESWAMLPGSVSEYQDCPASQKFVSHVLTAEDIDAIVNHHGLLLQGQDIILTKLTIE